MSVSSSDNKVLLKNGACVPNDGTIGRVVSNLEKLGGYQRERAIAISALKTKCLHPDFDIASSPVGHPLGLLIQCGLITEKGEIPIHFRDIIISAIGKLNHIQNPRA